MFQKFKNLNSPKILIKKYIFKLKLKKMKKCPKVTFSFEIILTVIMIISSKFYVDHENMIPWVE